jgi:hypothetical protein
MLHKAVLSFRDGQIRPYHVQCTCSTAGDFATASEAQAWIEEVHFRRRSGIETTEFVSLITPTPPTDGADAPPPPAVQEKKEEPPEEGETVANA